MVSEMIHQNGTFLYISGEGWCFTVITVVLSSLSGKYSIFSFFPNALKVYSRIYNPVPFHPVGIRDGYRFSATLTWKSEIRKFNASFRPPIILKNISRIEFMRFERPLWLFTIWVQLEWSPFPFRNLKVWPKLVQACRSFPEIVMPARDTEY